MTSTTTYVIPQGQLLSFKRDGATYQVHSDALGSVRMVTDSNGSVVFRAEYDAWGNTLSVTDNVFGGMPYRFVGSLGVRWDADFGLYYMRQRWYDPQLGEFISQDPIGLSGGLNLYEYVNSRPVNAIDPLGLDAWTGVVYGGSAMVGLVGGSTQWGTLTNQRTGESCKVKLTCWAGGLGASVGFPISPLTIKDGPKEGLNLDSQFSGKRTDLSVGFSAKLGPLPFGIGASATTGGGFGVNGSAGIPGIPNVIKSSIGNLGLGFSLAGRTCTMHVLDCTVCFRQRCLTNEGYELYAQ